MIPLPPLTADFVNVECNAFDHDPSTRLTEESLALLLSHFPENNEVTHVLLKVATLNQLYGTNIFAVQMVASHIVDLRIDTYLRSGSLQVVDLIAKVKIGDKVRNNFSFATKYCSWHNPNTYPIYDDNVVSAGLQREG